ncbi:hypothetical protein ACIGXQ_10140 [Streptomyces anulatus]
MRLRQAAALPAPEARGGQGPAAVAARTGLPVAEALARRDPATPEAD